jgi:alpha-tubulin suppressor-like RCC1 family protein
MQKRSYINSWKFFSLLIFGALCVADANGQIGSSSVIGWGTNWVFDSPGINLPQNLTNVVTIAAGGESCLALRTDGTVVNWGAFTNVPPNLANVVAISEGHDFSLALSNDGHMVAWGYNGSDVTNVPPGLSNVVAVSAGSRHCLALQADGTVTAWGDNGSGETNVPFGLADVVAIAAGSDISLALQSNGTVVAWGLGMAQTPSSLTNVIEIAAGTVGNLAITDNGTVTAWNFAGVKAVPSGLTNVQSIAVGHTFLALNGDGTVVAWGGFDVGYGLTNVPPGLSNVVAIAGGTEFGMVLQRSGLPLALGPIHQATYSGAPVVMKAYVTGTMPLSYQWQFDGTNILGATMPWLFLTSPQLASAGIYSIAVSNTMGIITNSAVVLSVTDSLPIIVGQPQSLQVPLGNNPTFSVNAKGSGPLSFQWQLNGTNIVDATNAALTLHNVQWADAGNYSVTASNAFGVVVSSNAALSFVRTSVIAWGNNSSGQCNVPPGLTNVVAIAAGNGFCLALNADGTVVPWGNNNEGECNLPTGLSNAVAISAGFRFGAALKNDGTVIAWGDNTYGQTNIPLGLSNVVAIASGAWHVLALENDGTVISWGAGKTNDPTDIHSINRGQSIIPIGLSNVVAIAGGVNSSFAITTNRTVVAWGDNTVGQTNVPPGLTNVMALGVSSATTKGLAVRSDGTLVRWGTYADAPTDLTNIVAASVSDNFGMAERVDHTVIVWGDNTSGELNIPPGLTNVIAVSAGGGNFALALDPSGGVITISVGPGGSGQLAYVTAHIGPAEALAAGGGWWATGMSDWSSASNYVATFGLGGSTTVNFKSIPGWNTPPSQNIILTLGQVVNISAIYTPTPPTLSFTPSLGLGITGTTGTIYRIEYRTNLSNGSWLPLKTNTLGSGFNSILPWPATNGPAAFYRAVWLP